MRDSFSDGKFFEERGVMLEYMRTALDYDKTLAAFEADEVMLQDEFKNLSRVKGVFSDVILESLLLGYSAGEDLASLHDRFLGELLRRLKVVVEELDKGHPDKYIFSVVGQETFIARRHSALVYLAWLVCLGAPSSDLVKIVPKFLKVGEDKFTDVVFGRYMEIGCSANTEYACNDFPILAKLLHASQEECSQLILEYLDMWPKIVDAIGNGSVGLSFSHGNGKIRDRNDLLGAINANYLGYWAWEVALAVKMFNIDDQKFSSHEFYPYDLVHFTPALDNADYLLALSKKVAAVEDCDEDDFQVVEQIASQVEEVSQLLSKDSLALNNHRFYLASKVMNPAASTHSAEGEQVRYSAYFLTAEDELREEANQILIARSFDNEYSKHSNNMCMHEFIDAYGSAEDLPFMEQVHLVISDGKDEYEYLYCSRHKENQVPPMMILRYRKKIGGVLMCIDCVVRDEGVKASEVRPHWESLIEKYRSI